MSPVKIRFLLLRASFGCGIFLLLVSCKSLEVLEGQDGDCGGGKEPISTHRSHEKTLTKANSKSKVNKPAEPEKPKIEVVPAVVKEVDQSLPELKEVDKLVPVAKANEIESETKVMIEAPKVADTKSEVATAAAPVSEVVRKDPDETAPINVKADSANRIIEAKGRDVVITGNQGVFVITGGCGILTLNGGKNQIQCDSVAQIEITGDGNILILGSIGGGRIRGSGNNLSWGRGLDGFSPIVESFGTNNSMKRLE